MLVKCASPELSVIHTECRHIEIRSNGSVSRDTIGNKLRFLQYVDAAIGAIPICKVTTEDIEGCLLQAPELSEK